MIQGARTLREPAAGPTVDFQPHVVHADVCAPTVVHDVIGGFGTRLMEEQPQPGSSRWPSFSRKTIPLVQISDVDARIASDSGNGIVLHMRTKAKNSK